MRWTRLRRISEANIGPNRFHHSRTVSWQMSMPRSNSRSSTFLRERGYRTFIMTTSRSNSGEESNSRYGLGALVLRPPRMRALRGKACSVVIVCINGDNLASNSDLSVCINTHR
jgi:hypothetical protein